MKYRQLNSPVCEAVQWFKSGDHPQDNCGEFYTKESGVFKGEGHVVRYYRRPDVSGEFPCPKCGVKMNDHGWIENGGDGFTVCPGDYVLFTDFYYPLDAKTFEANYGPIATGDEKVDYKQSEAEARQLLENLRARRFAGPLKEEIGAAIYKIREAIHWIQDALGKLQ